MQEYMFIYRTQSSGCYPTNHLFIKMKNMIGHKTGDPWGTPDNTGTGSEALQSKTTC